MTTHELSEESVDQFQNKYSKLKEAIATRVVGYEREIDEILTAVFAGGHVLLEGVPGLGKTLMVRTISEATHLSFSRVQFTPDLMPADITGTNVLVEDDRGARTFRFEKGPLFANLVLADEINRATPKTQSAVLEAMQEQGVTVGGRTHPLPSPFWVLATQNPIEMEGTYPLPEAQVDRFFFKVDMLPQGEEELIRIIDLTTGDDETPLEAVLTADEILHQQHTVRQVMVAEFVQRYAARLALGTSPDSPYATDLTKRFVRFGSSPRGLQSIILAGKVRALLEGRYTVSCDDIRYALRPALRHRVIRNFEGEAEGISTDKVLNSLVETVAEPAA